MNLLRKIGTGIVLATLGVSTLAQSKGLDLLYMDTSVDACDNFYQYANGGWLKTAEIPAAFSSWGASNILRERNNEVLRQILEESAQNTKAAKNSDARMVGDFYASCMDEAAIDKAGTKPIEPFLKQIEQIKKAGDLPAVLGRMHRVGTFAAFGSFIYPDLENSKINLAYFWQSGLSLPNRDYYTKTDDKSQKLREQFVAHVRRMFALSGDAPDKAAQHADAVMKFEMRLADASRTPVEERDIKANFNRRTFAELKAAIPDFDLEIYLKELGSPTIKEVSLAQPEFFKTVNQMIKDVSIADWKTYLRWQVLKAAAPYLAKKFEDENFAFFKQTLTGAKEQQPRWRRCADWTDAAVGEALGQEFVKRKFTPEAKRRMNELIDNLLAAYRERIQNLDWMSEATKKQALAKLDAIGRKIGYPDKPRGYAGLTVDRQSFFGNVYRAKEFNLVRDLQEIGKPVDKTRWTMTAPTVNAYYSPTLNEIVFPAGTLQPPRFDPTGDDAINYGSVGIVIGHEITHGFDDQGSLFDADGNLKMWWTQKDRSRFEEKADCVVKQFDGYEADKNLFINGKLTLGENIADLGGVIIAYNAFKKSLEGKPRPAKVDGFTPEQRFFLGYAQSWLKKYQPESVRLLVQSDPHSVADWRVMGPLSNMPEFAEAFGCKIGDPMVRQKRCQVW